MQNSLHILPEDRLYAQSRITTLERLILELGEEFNVALRQSNETWHDNAAFDAARDKQSVLAAELQSLRETLRNASTTLPTAINDHATYGDIVELKMHNKTHLYRIGGDWTPHAGKVVDSCLIVSAKSPVGQALFGARSGSTIVFPPKSKDALVVSIRR